MFPQIRFNDRWLTDTSWTRLEYSYKARGSEKFMVIGNALSDKSTGRKPVEYRSSAPGKEKWNLYESEEAAYYYFDALSLVVKRSEPAKVEEKQAPPEEETVEEEITIEKVREDTIFVLKKIFFEFDKAELLPESTAELNRLLDFLNRHPEISIQIEGHADNVGSFEYNIGLSEKRAKAVVNYLVEQGINRSRLKSVGYGYTQPARSNETDQARAENRRVAFRIIE